MEMLPSALRWALENQKLVALCGAGISVAPPSSLPSWWDFNALLLEQIKSFARRVLPANLAESLEILKLDTLPVQSFSNEIVQAFAGDSYFPVLDIFDSRMPNANHRALAELARRGNLKAVICTNFDSLIEQAFSEISEPLHVCATREDYRHLSSTNGCALLKIHGSAGSSASLVDTVSQKLRGLPEFVRARLEELFANFHVLVLGYSGADLSFGDDYLALSASAPRETGISWLTRPDAKPTFEAERAVSMAGRHGTFIGMCCLISSQSSEFRSRHRPAIRIQTGTAKPPKPRQRKR